jgi:hypothetical protein
MVQSAAKTVAAYLKSLPADRRAALTAVRDTVNANLPEGYQEGMLFGMVGWYIPLSRYPDTYNKQPLAVAALASQKSFMTLYLMGCYGDAATRSWFEKEWKKTGKKLDMGKSCLHFKKVEDLDLGLIGEVIARIGVDDYLKAYEQAKPPKPKKPAKPKTPAKQR